MGNKFLWIAMIQFCGLFILNMVFFASALVALNHGFPAMAGLMVQAVVASGFLTQMNISPLSVNYGNHKLMMVSAVMLTMGGVMFPYTSSWISTLAVCICVGCADMLLQSPANAWLENETKHARVFWRGLLRIILILNVGVSAVVSVRLIEYPDLFAMLCGLSGLATIVLVGFQMKNIKESQKNQDSQNSTIQTVSTKKSGRKIWIWGRKVWYERFHQEVFGEVLPFAGSFIVSGGITTILILFGREQEWDGGLLQALVYVGNVTVIILFSPIIKRYGHGLGLMIGMFLLGGGVLLLWLASLLNKSEIAFSASLMAGMGNGLIYFVLDCRAHELAGDVKASSTFFLVQIPATVIGGLLFGYFGSQLGYANSMPILLGLVCFSAVLLIFWSKFIYLCSRCKKVKNVSVVMRRTLDIYHQQNDGFRYPLLYLVKW
jgi:MFS family permease